MQARDRILSQVETQPYYRGDIIIASDIRRQFQIMSQSVAGIYVGIQEVVSQNISLTGLHDCSKTKLRKGVTGGCWQVHRFEKDSAVDFWNASAGKFKTRFVVARRSTAFKFLQPQGDKLQVGLGAVGENNQL